MIEPRVRLMADQESPTPTEDGGVGLDALYRRWRMPLVRLAYVLTRDRALADELVHDAFVGLLAHPGVDNPAGYLRRAVVNGCNSVHRRAAVRRRHAAAVRHAGELAADREAARAVADPATGEDAELAAALQRLPAPLRTVLVLRFHLDLAHDEIADALGVPVVTVRTRLHRALARLRKELSP